MNPSIIKERMIKKLLGKTLVRLSIINYQANKYNKIIHKICTLFRTMIYILQLFIELCWASSIILKKFVPLKSVNDF